MYAVITAQAETISQISGLADERFINAHAFKTRRGTLQFALTRIPLPAIELANTPPPCQCRAGFCVSDKVADAKLRAADRLPHKGTKRR